MGGEIAVDGVRHAIGGLVAPGVGHERLQILLVRDIAQFDQDRGHVRRAQHAKAGRFDRILVQPHRVLHVADELVGELHRKGLGLALRQVDQDAGDIVGLRLEIDAGDDVGAVLLLGEPRRGRIGRGLRQRVDRRALGIALLARQGIGVDRHEQRRAGAAGDAHAVAPAA